MAGSKKILYVWKSPYPWDVRIEKICTSLAENGCEVHILALREERQPQTEKIGNLNIIRTKFIKGSKKSIPVSMNPFWKTEISKAAREIQADLIIVREIMLAELCSNIARQLDIPVIMDMAEHYPAAMKDFNKYYKNLINRVSVHYLKLPDKIEKKSTIRMDGILSVSKENSLRLIKNNYYPPKNIIEVHNTPKLDWFSDIRKGCQKSPVVYAYHGHFSNVRNLDILIKSFIIAAKTDKNIRLVMAGTGENFKEISDIRENSDVKDRITLTGFYNHKDTKKLYSEMDIGILPYKNNEFINNIISNKLFDYMACGKPVIVSEAYPMIRIMEETNAGIITDCNNPDTLAQKMLEIKNMDLESMSHNGIKAAETKYNWTVDEQKMIDFFKRYI